MLKVAAIEKGLDGGVVAQASDVACRGHLPTGYTPRTPKSGGGPYQHSSCRKAAGAVKRNRSREFMSYDDDYEVDAEEEEPSTSQQLLTCKQREERHSALFAALDGDCGGWKSGSTGNVSRKAHHRRRDSPAGVSSGGEGGSSCEADEAETCMFRHLPPQQHQYQQLNTLMGSDTVLPPWSGPGFFGPASATLPLSSPLMGMDTLALMFWQHQQQQEQAQLQFGFSTAATLAMQQQLARQGSALSSALAMGSGDVTRFMAGGANVATAPGAGTAQVDAGAGLKRTASVSCGRRKQGSPRRSPHL